MRFQYLLGEEKAYELGRDLFELYVNLGTAERMNSEFYRRHPDFPFSVAVNNLRRAKNWFVHYTEDGIELFKKYRPKASDEDIERLVMSYALRLIQSKKNFMSWLDKNPWAKKYESMYKDFYGV